MILSVIIVLAVLFVVALILKTNTDNIENKDKFIKRNSKVPLLTIASLVFLLLIIFVRNNPTTLISSNANTPTILCDDIMYPSKPIE
jgi:hypothetical protein